MSLEKIKNSVLSRSLLSLYLLNKFYTDFVAVTKKGNIIELEWKGEDRVSNEDTEYKIATGEMWVKSGKSKLHFFLVHNSNLKEVLTELKEL